MQKVLLLDHSLTLESGVTLKVQVCRLDVLLGTVHNSKFMENQVSVMVRKVYYQFRLICKSLPFLKKRDLATVTRVLVTSQFDYCNTHYMGCP